MLDRVVNAYMGIVLHLDELLSALLRRWRYGPALTNVHLILSRSVLTILDRQAWVLDVEFREEQPAPESPADGKNIIRGLIARGYSDEDVRKIAGGNALALFRRVMG